MYVVSWFSFMMWLLQTLHRLFSSDRMGDMKVMGLQSVMSSPFVRSFNIQPPAAAAESAALIAAVDEDLLEQIKARLRETLLENGFLATQEQQNENQVGV